jgi:hypothetical protein
MGKSLGVSGPLSTYTARAQCRAAREAEGGEGGGLFVGRRR